ncbi:hypothetical protein FQA39_LY02312 [Lamprigera yunnana]|nr:hypothetical protein FQA39_LY02312 [Lamprigera yunnana]
MEGELDQSLSQTESTVFFWSANTTKSLIDLYNKYRSKVGCMKIKNFKAMWDVIEKELSNLLNTEISPKNYENPWKVFDRNYKKWIDNKNSTGHGRKLFEFSKEMDDIYGKKRSINPILSLGNEIHVSIGIIQNVADNTNKTEAPSSSSSENIVERHNRGEFVRKKALKKRKTVLEQMREDRLQYQEKRLAFLERAHKEAIKLLKEKNEIKMERNENLKQKNCLICKFFKKKNHEKYILFLI